MALLEVENLQTHFATLDGVVRAVEGVSFHVDAGETLGIVGESGCGKSVTAMSILRLIQEPPGKIAGAIRFEGRNLLEVPEPEMRDIRGNAISMIFQEPMTSLNPVLTVGQADRRDAAAAPGPVAARRREAGDRHAGAGRHSRAAAAGARISASAFRRHAPAGDDRDGAGVQSEAADRRRADDGAGRDDPGADPRPDARSEEPAGLGDHADHARPRRGGRDVPARGGDVRRAQGRGGPGRGDLRPSAASLHAGAARFGAEARFVAGGWRPHQAGGDPRPGAELAAEDRRLCVRRALPDGDRAVQPRHAGDRDQGTATTWSPATTPRRRMAA